MCCCQFKSANMGLACKGFILILAVSVILYFCICGTHGWGDFCGQRLICEYFHLGITPYISYSFDFLCQSGLSQIPHGFGASPWGGVLGQLFYCSYFSETYAMYWFVVTWFVVYFVSFLFTLKYSGLSERNVFAIFLLIMVNYQFAFSMGNAGEQLSLLALFSIFIKDKNFILSGICMGFAMIKPQLALPLCLYLFFKKCYYSLIIAFMIDILAYLFASSFLNISPFDLLSQFLSCNIGNGESYNGLFTLIIPLVGKEKICFYGSMIICLLSAALMFFKNKGKGELLEIAPFCMAAAAWSYTWGHELLVLIPIGILCYARINKNISLYSLVYMIGALAVFFALPIVIALTRLFSMFYVSGSITPFQFAMSFYLLSMILLLIIFSIKEKPCIE